LANGDSFIISDPEESWILQIAPCDHTGMNAVWVAQKLEEGHFAIVPNVFTIRDVELDNPLKFKYSNNFTSVAESWGKWKTGDKTLDFAGT